MSRTKFYSEKSGLFWEVDLIEKTLFVMTGPIGTDGEEVFTNFDSVEEAQAEAQRRIEVQIADGFVETTRPPAVAFGTSPEAVAALAGLERMAENDDASFDDLMAGIKNVMQHVEPKKSS